MIDGGVDGVGRLKLGRGGKNFVTPFSIATRIEVFCTVAGDRASSI